MLILLLLLVGCQKYSISNADSIFIDSDWFSSEDGTKEKLINRINEERWLYNLGIIKAETISDWFGNYNSTSKYYYTEPIETYCLNEDGKLEKLTENNYYCILFGDENPLFALIHNGGVVSDQNMGPYIFYDKIKLSDSYFIYHTYEGLLCIVDQNNYSIADVWHYGEQLDKKDISNIEYLRTIADFNDYDKYELDLSFSDQLAVNMNYLFYNINPDSEDSKKAKQIAIDELSSISFAASTLLMTKKEVSEKTIHVGDEIIYLQLVRGDRNTSYITRGKKCYYFPIYVDGFAYCELAIELQDGEYVGGSCAYFDETEILYEALMKKQRLVLFNGYYFTSDGTVFRSDHVENPIKEKAFDIIQQLASQLKSNKLVKVKTK